MSAFLTPLRVEEVDEGDPPLWRLLEPLRYESDLIGGVLEVPADFLTDFASVPRWPLMHMVVAGKGNRAAVVHDFLYSSGLHPREACDQVFAEALTACGYSRLTVWLMYRGVRIGGASHFNAPNVPQEPHVEAAMLEAP
jgi:hypothetical protein